MSKRRAPKAGYDFGNKRQYRRTIWKRFREHCGTRRSVSQALLICDKPDEIPVALANGFREENLHVVNHNPALVAHAKRVFPKIHTYGVSLVDACERIARAGIQLDVANFDLCSCIGQQVVDDMHRIVRSRALSDRGLIAVTLLRGREKFGEFDKAINEVNGDGDLVRMIALSTALSDVPNGLIACGQDFGHYRSSAGSQTMLWTILKMMRWAPGELARVVQFTEREIESGNISFSATLQAAYAVCEQRGVFFQKAV